MQTQITRIERGQSLTGSTILVSQLLQTALGTISAKYSELDCRDSTDSPVSSDTLGCIGLRLEAKHKDGGTARCA